jgi:hypothetical protein
VLASSYWYEMYVYVFNVIQIIYCDQDTVYIKGNGFKPLETSLIFANGLLGKGVNFTITAITTDSVKLKLAPGSSWLQNMKNLPGYLTLLAVNTGEGFVAVGPTDTAKGIDIATVLEKPTVYADGIKIYRTHSSTLHVRGAGFSKTNGHTQLRFSPPLVESINYSIEVIDRNLLKVSLLSDRSWRSEAGPLAVSAINTKGTEDGWVTIGGEAGVHVAEVVDDIFTEATGGVEIYPSIVWIYQSALQRTIKIRGTGFREGMSLELEPDIKEGVDYDLEVTTKSKLTLKLRTGKKWRQHSGFVVVKRVKIGDTNYELGGTHGAHVAMVLTDPRVEPGETSFHETQSKVVSLAGTGFSNVADTKVSLSPTEPGAYTVVDVSHGVIRLQLTSGSNWLPSSMSLAADQTDKKVPLEVLGLDTGAGMVMYDQPIVIGYIIKDKAGVTCDDSCEFAFDGTCDYGTEGKESNHDRKRTRSCATGTDCTDCGGVDVSVLDQGKLGGDGHYSSMRGGKTLAKTGSKMFRFGLIEGLVAVIVLVVLYWVFPLYYGRYVPVASGTDGDIEVL